VTYRCQVSHHHVAPDRHFAVLMLEDEMLLHAGEKPATRQ